MRVSESQPVRQWLEPAPPPGPKTHGRSHSKRSTWCMKHTHARFTGTPRPAAQLLRVVALIAASAVLASACAEDDPITFSDENSCELQATDGVGASAADDDEADADEHDDEADANEHDDDEVAGVDYVVEIDMLEFGYSCDLPRLDLGTVLELRMTNIGAVEHEAVFGDLAAQTAAAAEMADASTAAEDNDGHADDHGSPTLVLAAGESGSIVVTMEEPGDMIIGCHVPGHWDAGMRSDFVVSA